MWREKTDKRIVAAGVLFISAIVGYKTWKDMQPHEVVKRDFTFTSYIIADRQDELSNFPKGVDSVIAWAGDVKLDGDAGDVAESPLTPVNLPQMETIVLLRIDSLPHAYASLFTKVNNEVIRWRSAGNLINDVYFDYASDDVDLEKLGLFSDALHAHAKNEYYTVIQLRRKVVEADPDFRNKMANMLKSVEFFVYDAKEAAQPGESLADTVKRLNGEGLPFSLRVTELPDNDMMAKNLTDNKDMFRGFLFDKPNDAEPNKTQKENQP